MSRQWMRIVLVVAMVFVLNGSGAQPSLQAAPEAAGPVIHFGCDAAFVCTYNPSIVVIQPGETVEWDGDFFPHPLVSDDSLWITPAAGAQFTHTFPVTGTFLFHCAIHGGPGGVGMSGRVIVKEFSNKVYLPVALSSAPG
jgi:plastocyanin